MKLDSQLRSSLALGVALALAACAAPAADDATGSSTLDGGLDLDTTARRHHPPPPPADAGRTTADAQPADSGGTTSGDPTRAGIISCYTEGSPTATCSLPTQCCFGNYSAAHDGECSTSSCSWGTITCDGPEDCASGQHCCAHVLVDPDWGILGYKLACQASACGSAPANQEMCHPTTTAAGTCSVPGTTCVPALGNDSDLPGTLHICK